MEVPTTSVDRDMHAPCGCSEVERRAVRASLGSDPSAAVRRAPGRGGIRLDSGAATVDACVDCVRRSAQPELPQPLGLSSGLRLKRSKQWRRGWRRSQDSRQWSRCRGLVSERAACGSGSSSCCLWPLPPWLWLVSPAFAGSGGVKKPAVAAQSCSTSWTSPGWWGLVGARELEQRCADGFEQRVYHAGGDVHGDGRARPRPSPRSRLAARAGRRHSTSAAPARATRSSPCRLHACFVPFDPAVPELGEGDWGLLRTTPPSRAFRSCSLLNVSACALD